MTPERKSQILSSALGREESSAIESLMSAADAPSATEAEAMGKVSTLTAALQYLTDVRELLTKANNATL